MYFQSEDQKTPPWRPEIRSQFLLTRTPPFLALKIWVCSDYLSIIKKATSPLHLWARSQYLLAEEKTTSPLHLWARSQFLLARTPPFLVFGLYRLRSQFLLNKLPWPSALTNLSRPSALTYLSRPSALTYLSPKAEGRDKLVKAEGQDRLRAKPETI